MGAVRLPAGGHLRIKFGEHSGVKYGELGIEKCLRLITLVRLLGGKSSRHRREGAAVDSAYKSFGMETVFMVGPPNNKVAGGQRKRIFYAVSRIYITVQNIFYFKFVIYNSDAVIGYKRNFFISAFPY